MKILYLIYKDKIFFEFLFNFREERSKTKFLESLSQNILRMFHLFTIISAYQKWNQTRFLSSGT